MWLRKYRQRRCLITWSKKIYQPRQYQARSLEQEARGIRNEARVRNILQKLRDGGRIVDFYKSDNDGELDNLGIDFIICVTDKLLIPLQVKSSYIGWKKHKRFSLDRVQIPCIVVQNKDTDWEVEGTVIRVIEFAVTEAVASTAASKKQPDK